MIQETSNNKSPVTLTELKILILNNGEHIQENTESILGLTKKVEENTTNIVGLSQKVDQNTASIAKLGEKADRNTGSIARLERKTDKNYKELKDRDLAFEKKFSRNIGEISETHTHIFDQLAKIDTKIDKVGEKLTERIDNMNNLLKAGVEDLMQGKRERFFIQAHLEGNDKRITRVEKKLELKKVGLQI